MLGDVAFGECLVTPSSCFLIEGNTQTTTSCIIQPVDKPSKQIQSAIWI